MGTTYVSGPRRIYDSSVRLAALPHVWQQCLFGGRLRRISYDSSIRLAAVPHVLGQQCFLLAAWPRVWHVSVSVAA